VFVCLAQRKSGSRGSLPKIETQSPASPAVVTSVAPAQTSYVAFICGVLVPVKWMSFGDKDLQILRNVMVKIPLETSKSVRFSFIYYFIFIFFNA
jgi:hypothetical protein